MFPCAALVTDIAAPLHSTVIIGLAMLLYLAVLLQLPTCDK